jgi:hypothetical protein
MPEFGETHERIRYLATEPPVQRYTIRTTNFG